MGEARAIMRTYTIYCDPIDLNAGYAVREFIITGSPKGAIPGKLLAAGVTLAEARDLVPEENDTRMVRSPDDDPSIVETWI